MKVFVISLRSSIERRDHIRRQLDPLDLDYEIFDAIKGADGFRCFDSYDEDQFLINTGRPVIDGEVGCYASHRMLWKKCSELNEPILILEDDATLERRFRAALSKVNQLIPRYGFIRLQHGLPRRGLRAITVEESDSFSLRYCQRFPYGAMCYAIAPDTAAAFVESSRTLAGPVDLFIKKFWEHKQALFVLFPPTVDGSGIHRSTTIVGDRSAKKPRIRLRVLRMLNKGQVFVARARFNHLCRARIQQLANQQGHRRNREREIPTLDS